MPQMLADQALQMFFEGSLTAVLRRMIVPGPLPEKVVRKILLRHISAEVVRIKVRQSPPQLRGAAVMRVHQMGRHIIDLPGVKVRHGFGDSCLRGVRLGAGCQQDYSLIMKMPGFFIAFVFIMTIKMRKSPFDTAASHHPHQELVKGITTDMGSKNLALFSITEWYENVFLMGVVALFIVNKNPWSYLAAVLVILAIYFLEILIDNTSARMKYELMLKMTWIVTLLTAGVNLLILMLIA